MAIQHIAFRTDTSNQIGTGHFMRCLTLAVALKQCDAQIRFVSRHLPIHLRDMLAAEKIEFKSLDSNANSSDPDELAHSHWLGTSQEQDAQDTLHTLSDKHWDWLIVDHYALDARWESMLRQSTRNILVIDDLADREHDCNILLDQNYYTDMESRYMGKVPVHCHILHGPHYALLRDEFRHMRKNIKPRSGPVKRILMFLGGIDADNYTKIAIEAVSELNIPDLYGDVVIGPQHPFREQIKAACAQSNFFCHINTNNIAKLMAAADLAIGASGTASWERCSLGLPALLVSLANNQIDIAKSLDQFGACVYLGPAELTSRSILHNATLKLLNQQDQLVTLSEKAYSLVDGLGVDRICQTLRC